MQVPNNSRKEKLLFQHSKTHFFILGCSSQFYYIILFLEFFVSFLMGSLNVTPFKHYTLPHYFSSYTLQSTKRLRYVQFDWTFFGKEEEKNKKKNLNWSTPDDPLNSVSFREEIIRRRQQIDIVYIRIERTTADAENIFLFRSLVYFFLSL